MVTPWSPYSALEGTGYTKLSVLRDGAGYQGMLWLTSVFLLPPAAPLCPHPCDSHGTQRKGITSALYGMLGWDGFWEAMGVLPPGLE